MKLHVLPVNPRGRCPPRTLLVQPNFWSQSYLLPGPFKILTCGVLEGVSLLPAENSSFLV